jgi:hypothetical protein
MDVAFEIESVKPDRHVAMAVAPAQFRRIETEQAASTL